MDSSATLQFLGTGSAFTPRFGTTCALLQVGDRRWLIDCGRQAPEQLRAAGLDWHQLDGQLVTHVHGDHVYGLEEFAMARFYQSGPGRRAVVGGGPRPWLIAHSAVRNELWEVLGPTLRYQTDSLGRPRSGVLSDYFDIVAPGSVEPPLPGSPWNQAETFGCREFQITARQTRHVIGKPCCSFELRVGCGSSEAKAWWSGDTVANVAELAQLSRGASVLFHDCTWRSFPGQVHTPFSSLAEVDPTLRRRIVLTHHDDDVLRHRSHAESLGFRLAMPGDVFDLQTGERLRRGSA